MCWGLACIYVFSNEDLTECMQSQCSLSPCCLVCALYLTFAQKVAFLPCPPSSFSRLEVYSNENFFDGLVRMRPPSPPLPCTSSLCSWPKLAPHLNHLFWCFATRRWTLWEHLLCFYLYFPSALHILGTISSAMMFQAWEGSGHSSLSE